MDEENGQGELRNCCGVREEKKESCLPAHFHFLTELFKGLVIKVLFEQFLDGDTQTTAFPLVHITKATPSDFLDVCQLRRVNIWGECVSHLSCCGVGTRWWDDEAEVRTWRTKVVSIKLHLTCVGVDLTTRLCNDTASGGGNSRHAWERGESEFVPSPPVASFLSFSEFR